jgi:hypothetical protein
MTLAQQVRDFMSVENIANKLLDACVQLSTTSSPVRIISNLGSGKPTTVRKFAEDWWRHWGGTGLLRFGAIPYRAGEVLRFVPDLTPVAF